MYRGLLAITLLAAPFCGGAFESYNRIRSDGVVRIGYLLEHAGQPPLQAAQEFSESLGFAPHLIAFDRPDQLLEALAAARIDLAASPMDRHRTLPEGLGFTVPFDLASLRLAGRIGPVAVRYRSDEWQRVLAMRAAGSDMELRVLPATTPQDALFEHPARRVLTLGPGNRGVILARDLPRAWVVREADRILRFKLNRFLHSRALVEDARRRRTTPAVGLLRASIRGALTAYDRLAQDYARFYGFDWRLILAVMDIESRFDPGAVSRAGAFGLMQLKPVAAREVGIRDIRLPEDNVLAGVRYLAWVHKHFEEDLHPLERAWFALAAYNGGLSRIREARQLAAAAGRDPNRWFGNVELAVRETGARHADFDAEQVIRYVRKVRARLGDYVRVTEEQMPGTTPRVFAMPLAP